MAQERGNRVGFRGVRIEDLVEPRDSQDFCDALGDLAQLEIAARRARPVQQAHEHARAAAIDVVDLANVEDDERLVGEYAADVLLQGLGLLTSNDPSTARHDGDVANAAGLQRQRHNASSLFDGKGHCPSALGAGATGNAFDVGRGFGLGPKPLARQRSLNTYCPRAPDSCRAGFATLPGRWRPHVGPQRIRFRPVAPGQRRAARSASGILRRASSKSIWARST